MGVEDADDGGASGGIAVIENAPAALVYEINAMAQFFGLPEPTVKMYNEPQNSSAHTYCYCERAGCPSKIFVGIKLWNELAPFGNITDGLRTILAHEMAHVYQCRFGLNRYPTSKLKEQAADFFAGYYLGKRQFAGLWTDISSGIMQIISRGDLQFNRDSGHGTRRERFRSIATGYFASGSFFPGVSIESIPMTLYSSSRRNVPNAGWYMPKNVPGMKGLLTWQGNHLVATLYNSFGGVIGTNTFRRSPLDYHVYLPVSPNSPDEEFYIIDNLNFLHITHGQAPNAMLYNYAP